MDAGKLGDQKLEEFTNDAYRNLTAVSKTLNCDLDFTFQKEICSIYQNSEYVLKKHYTVDEYYRSTMQMTTSLQTTKSQDVFPTKPALNIFGPPSIPSVCLS